MNPDPHSPDTSPPVQPTPDAGQGPVHNDPDQLSPRDRAAEIIRQHYQGLEKLPESHQYEQARDKVREQLGQAAPKDKDLNDIARKEYNKDRDRRAREARQRANQPGQPDSVDTGQQDEVVKPSWRLWSWATDKVSKIRNGLYILAFVGVMIFAIVLNFLPGNNAEKQDTAIFLVIGSVLLVILRFMGDPEKNTILRIMFLVAAGAVLAMALVLAGHYVCRKVGYCGVPEPPPLDPPGKFALTAPTYIDNSPIIDRDQSSEAAVRSGEQTHWLDNYAAGVVYQLNPTPMPQPTDKAKMFVLTTAEFEANYRPFWATYTHGKSDKINVYAFLVRKTQDRTTTLSQREYLPLSREKPYSDQESSSTFLVPAGKAKDQIVILFCATDVYLSQLGDKHLWLTNVVHP